MKLTRCEKSMLARLQEEEIMFWHDTIGCEVQTLNRLAKKGAVIQMFQGDPNNKKNQYWVMK